MLFGGVKQRVKVGVMEGLLGDVWWLPLSVPFVSSPMAKPLPSCSVPVRFTPYNSLQVFDISKHTHTQTHTHTCTGQNAADVAGARATQGVIVSDCATYTWRAEHPPVTKH